MSDTLLTDLPETILRTVPTHGIVHKTSLGRGGPSSRGGDATASVSELYVHQPIAERHIHTHKTKSQLSENSDVTDVSKCFSKIRLIFFSLTMLKFSAPYKNNQIKIKICNSIAKTLEHHPILHICFS
jgi:hypothetical protein